MGVAVNPPKTPVTAGSKGIAAATLPNICKMPGPPAPFVPTPLPNIGKSDSSPQGYSTTVTIEGNAVAIQGATFNSIGDVASQGTGGGIVSSNVQGPTSFIGPGSLDVAIEGKAVQLLSDQMLNNGGPSGSPANAATMAGLIQAPEIALMTTEKATTLCPGGQAHQWVVMDADDTPSLEEKIKKAKASRPLGHQFEGKAAEHNMASGDLKRPSQLSSVEGKDEEKIWWICNVCKFPGREGDQLHDGPTPGSPPVAVEVKSGSELDEREFRQLGRNIQAVQQGGASGLTYKLQAGPAGEKIAAQVKEAGEVLQCPIQIVRV
jgi:hypothetical protein